ncbi:hypothetical protein R50073_26270 [Maricurvus nonylphenolicus]|uniref:hypothetical protein n=1 Tax=Maricurvus nonylphenolicus TaxID=1008307 RepID=UPI0036F2D3E6
MDLLQRVEGLRVTALMVLGLMLVGCESENEHFCAKYQYYYRELTAPGILPIRDLREQLEKDLAKSPDSDPTKMALFVLNDIEADIKPEAEEPRDYCMRRQRWTRYR